MAYFKNIDRIEYEGAESDNPLAFKYYNPAMYEVLKAGGFTTGGLNFDAKVRRGSFEPIDLVYAHIAGMDAFAKGFKTAYKMLSDGRFGKNIAERYKSYSEGIGKEIVEGRADFNTLSKYALEHDNIVNTSGRQEALESLLNSYILNN
jgi:xylose isomerase